MDQQAINRILDAVGREHTPETLDSVVLGEELARCATWYAVASDITDLAQAKRDFKHLDAINGVTRRLDRLLVRDDLIRHEIAAKLPGGIVALEAVVRGIIATTKELGPRTPYSREREAEIEKHLIAAIDDKHGMPQGDATSSVLAEVRDRKGSALEWLVCRL